VFGRAFGSFGVTPPKNRLTEVVRTVMSLVMTVVRWQMSLRFVNTKMIMIYPSHSYAIAENTDSRTNS
jgi:hypothetical protein